MDPNAVLDALQWEYEEGDFESAAEYLYSLKVWLSRGGFPPARWAGKSPEEIQSYLARWDDRLSEYAS